MRRITLLISALLAVASPALAGDVTLSWTNPDMTEQCVAGTAYTNPGGTRLWQLVAEIPDPTQSISTYTIPAMVPGTYDYVATTYDDQGVESRVSGKAQKIVTEFVTTDTKAYYIIQQPNLFLAVVVGSVPLGTACNPDQSVNGLYSVPQSEVTFTGTSQPLVVVAQCG